MSQSNQENVAPKWREDFPIDTEQDSRVARRDFVRFILLVSAGLFSGSLGIFLRRFLTRKEGVTSKSALKILDKNALRVGESHVFQLQKKNEPALLIRLAQDQYVAYSQKCTHLQCPVLWNKESGKILCPCHNGAFSASTGDVLYGPPERPLPKVDIVVNDDGIYYND